MQGNLLTIEPCPRWSTFVTIYGSFPWLGRRFHRDGNKILPSLLHRITDHLNNNPPVDYCFFGVYLCKSHMGMHTQTMWFIGLMVIGERDRWWIGLIVAMAQIDYIQILINIIHFNSLFIIKGILCAWKCALNSMEDINEKNGSVLALRNCRVAKTFCEIGNPTI